jgi:AraC-like DNA-binding protein
MIQGSSKLGFAQTTGGACGEVLGAGVPLGSRSINGVRVGRQEMAVVGGERADGLPGVAVRGRVRAYLGYREETPSPVRRWETPAGELIVIVGRGDGFRAQAAPGDGELRTYTSFVAGIHDRPTPTVHHGRQFGVQIRLDPLAAFSLFGVPMHELGNRIVDLSDLLGLDAERWAGRLGDARDWPERFAVLDRLLADRMAAGPAPSPQVAWAWQTMRQAGGAVRVADLAAGVGRSHRHLVALFREQVGTTPKIAAQVLRYERAARLLARGDMSPARVAAVCGYADQPHLTREFARFAGMTPAAALRSKP